MHTDRHACTHARTLAQAHAHTHTHTHTHAQTIIMRVNIINHMHTQAGGVHNMGHSVMRHWLNISIYHFQNIEMYIYNNILKEN